MRTPIFTVLLLALAAFSLFGQGDIVNTLGSGGTFSIEYGLDTFLQLDQADGHLDLFRSLTLPVTTSSSLGIIFKGSNRFMHDFKAASVSGQNTFLGELAGNFTMSGTSDQASQNSAVGYATLTALTTGKRNSAFGYRTLYTNNSGQSNSGYGDEALHKNTSGSSNAGFGGDVLFNNTTGSYNSAFGVLALHSITTGSDHNTAIGYNAGYNLTNGSNNSFIGHNAQPSAATVSDEITLGNSSVTVLRCYAPGGLTTVSDSRDKRNIKDVPVGLNFLMSVKPRVFNWDRREWYGNEKADGSKMKKEPTVGFIAQELDEAQTEANAEWLNLVLKSNPEKLEATPGNLLPIMVKAIQELKKENDALQERIAKLENPSVSHAAKSEQ